MLDPACGSGNFLYVALQALKDLEHEVVTFAEQVGAPGFRLVGPRQFHGIEINPFARELASMVVWIGFLQWNRANGISNAQRPILEPLGNIRLHDALMNEDGTEYEWPEAEFMIGNPPFLGNYKMRGELGSDYVDGLYTLFRQRIPNKSDLVCYWFEKARALVASGHAHRVGLLATNSIRGGANRTVLQRILESGNIFLAWSDVAWILDGAAVRVSVVGFDDGSEQIRTLDGAPVARIHADLRSGFAVGSAVHLHANRRRSFEGVKPAGPFDVTDAMAKVWFGAPNRSGRNNADVLKRFYQGRDVTVRDQRRWIVDFNEMSIREAQKYEAPYAYVEARVRPRRQKNRRDSTREIWWQYDEARPGLRGAIAGLSRFLVTPRHMKHRAFVWVPNSVLPGDALSVIATDDDYVFGVLHSRLHEVWSLAQGTSLEDRPRYTPSTCFETFPFPEHTGAQQRAVSEAARHLDNVRSHLLGADTALTLTKLYNEVAGLREERDVSTPAFPLLLAHEALDEAVAAAYGWEWPLEDDEILSRLLTLNLERAEREAAGQGLAADTRATADGSGAPPRRQPRLEAGENLEDRQAPEGHDWAL